jgi:hypothetical protein
MTIKYACRGALMGAAFVAVWRGDIPVVAVAIVVAYVLELVA